MRHVLTAFVSAVLFTLLTPASPALALDDNLTCVDFRTRSFTEGYETTIIGYCARWHWTPPETVYPESGDRPEQPGGPGGGVEAPGRRGDVDCYQARKQLAELDRQYEQLFLDWQVRLGDLMKAEEAYKPQQAATEAARQAWLKKRATARTWLNMYLKRSGLPVQTYTNIKGVEVPKDPQDYTDIDLNKPYSWLLIDAIADERAANEAYVAEQRKGFPLLNAVIAAQEALDHAFEMVTAHTEERALIQGYIDANC
ncbi:hypothetical protein [Catellatospora sp. NPDC049609]|uniref:hypothetical protein n=1 Tax=Catellatospora sp. NPDC049609 TaxID=3155505 RepID=UPI00342FAAAC